MSRFLISYLVVLVILSSVVDAWLSNSPARRNRSPSNAFRGDEECGGDISVDDTPGFITSPNFGSWYSQNTQCVWTFEAPEGKVIQFRLSLISIEVAYALCDQEYCCPHDNLTIYNRGPNGNEALSVLCGYTVPEDPFVTDTNQATVKFLTDLTGTGKGFKLHYSIQDTVTSESDNGCPDSVVTLTEEGSIRSVGYEDAEYVNKDHCLWKIQAPLGSESSSCAYDFLMLHDGSDASAPEHGPYCGSQVPPDFDSTGNEIFITFTTDVSYNLGKFSVTWKFVQPAESHNKVPPGCNGTIAILDRMEGSFASPKVHGTHTYPDNSDCAWKIVAPAGKVVRLSFDEFILEKGSSTSRCFDHVSVYDGDDTTAERISYECGDNIPGDITSTRNTLYVVFKSDSSVKKQGFVALYAHKTEGTSRPIEIVDPLHDICGVPAVSTKLARIVGGDDSNPHAWPWQVSVRFRRHNNFGHWCGGSIISRKWVITAAHCVFGYGSRTNFKVRIGEHNQLTRDTNELTVDIAEMIVHPNYNDTTKDSDIAVFRLKNAISYSRQVRPVCLPKADVKEMIMCVVTGWGKTQGTGNRDILQEVRVPVISRETCNQKTWYHGKLSTGMLCAGYPEGRKDSCQGDSGGPLVCHEDGVYRLHGIVSWGFGCAAARHPGVYTKVTRYLSWIEEHTGGEDMSPLDISWIIIS